MSQQVQEVPFRENRDSQAEIYSSRIMTVNYDSNPINERTPMRAINRGQARKLSKFKLIMLSKRDSSRFKKLPHHLQVLINDSTENFHQLKTALLKRYPFVIHPDNKNLVFWNLLFMITLSVNLFFLPYKIAFQIEESQMSKIERALFEYLPLVSHLIDIIITLNTAFYSKGKIHEERQIILKNYLSQYFVLDIVLISSQILSFFVTQVFDCLLTLRFIKLNTTFVRLQTRLGLKERYQLFVISKLVLNMMYIIHYSACAFLLIGLTEENNKQRSWVNLEVIQSDQPVDLYIASLYWSSITLFTVGYGDITPQTSIERIFCLFITLFNVGAVGYLINSISQIYIRMNETQEKINRKLIKLEFFLQRNDINKDLAMRIKNYYEFWFGIKTKDEGDDYKFSKHLTLPLKRELYESIYESQLKKSWLINKYLSKECLIELCQKVKQSRYLPNEQIFAKGDPIDRLMFIKSGSVSICNISQRVNVITKVDASLRFAGDIICQENFFFQKNSYFDAKCRGICVINYIEHDDFIEVLRNFPDDYEKYMFIRSRYENNLDLEEMKKCELCKEPHSFENCHQIFQAKNHGKIILKHIKWTLNQRQNYERSLRRKFSLNQTQIAAMNRLLDDEKLNIEEITDDYLERLGFCEFKRNDRDKVNHNFVRMTATVFSDGSQSSNDSLSESQNSNQIDEIPKECFGAPKQQSSSFRKISLQDFAIKPTRYAQIRELFQKKKLSIDYRYRPRKGVFSNHHYKSADVPSITLKMQSETSEFEALSPQFKKSRQHPQNMKNFSVSNQLIQIENNREERQDEDCDFSNIKNQTLQAIQTNNREQILKNDRNRKDLNDFEMLKDYNYYYPEFNHGVVISKYNNRMLSEISQQQKIEMILKLHFRASVKKRIHTSFAKQ